MSILNQIRKDQLSARKKEFSDKSHENSIAASLLTTLIGEASMVGKNNGNRESTDFEVIAVIKKFIKNIDESLNYCHDDDLVIERYILNQYLPKQLNDEELTEIIKSFIVTLFIDPNIGVIMKHLKENYDGQYDGKTASILIRELLK